MQISDEMVNRADSILSWSYPGIPDETIRFALASALESQEPGGRAFCVGQKVRKKSGSWWEGFVVGHYATKQTPDGVCVQLDKPMGPVQIYPASALELCPAAQ